jgi:hypothetical protein
MTNNLNYAFNVDLATKYGVNEAIFLNNLIYWINQNEANGTNFYKGRYWTYNTIEAYTKLFPFWSTRQIRTIMDKLEVEGVITKRVKMADNNLKTTFICVNVDVTYVCIPENGGSI